MQDASFTLPFLILSKIDLVWTFFLLLTRFAIFMSIVPGIGMGMSGLTIRMPAVVIMAMVSVRPDQTAGVPPDIAVMSAQLLSEIIVGAMIGIIPLLIVSGAQAAGQLAAGTMGLTGSQLFDPSAGASVSDISKIYGDLTVALFLLLGGHYSAIHLLSTLGDHMVPGSFMLSDGSINMLIDRSAKVLSAGVMLSAPVVVALLLTNFVMGMVSKAVPTVNIFIVSFPLTIGIGMFLIVLSLPEAFVFVRNELSEVERVWQVLIGT